MKKVITSRAHPVQGILCAHGYRDSNERTLPVEAIFVAIRAYEIRATCELNGSNTPRLKLYSNGNPIEGPALERMTSFVSRLRSDCQPCDIEINLRQNFPSGIGIGSSAAVFASVAHALASLDGPPPSEQQLSASARRGSYSAAAAVSGNVSVIRARKKPEENFGEVLCPACEFPFRLLIIPIEGTKQSEAIHADIVSSTYYPAWKLVAKTRSARMIRAIQSKDWKLLGGLAEDYIFENLAAICTGPRRLMPWAPDTFRVIQELRALRTRERLDFFISTNSGPAVFVYALPDQLSAIRIGVKRIGLRPTESEVGGEACIQEG